MSINPSTVPPSRKVIGQEKQKLRVDLTEHEKRRASEDLIACLSELAAHEREATEVKAQLARKQKGLEARRGNLHQLIVAGYEYRDVDVERIADYNRGVIVLCRVDTGAEVDIERMPEGMSQLELNLREQQKNREDADRPSDPNDVGDGDPYGAPSDGRAPIAELPPPSDDVIDAEFVKDDENSSNDDDGGNASASRGAPATGTAAQSPSSDGLDPEALRIKTLTEWLSGQGEAVARVQLETADVEDVRAVYALVMGEPAGRAQKRTMIPKIIERLFKLPF